MLFLCALCHTVIIDQSGDDLIYNAASPDELALVSFAKWCGVEYRGKDENNNMIINFLGKEFRYKELHVFEFNSDRKRMSVVF